MTRRMKPGVELGPVAAYPVAPHRYKWDAVTPDDLAITWREVRDAAPYKVGEVVFVVEVGVVVLVFGRKVGFLGRSLATLKFVAGGVGIVTRALVFVSRGHGRGPCKRG